MGRNYYDEDFVKNWLYRTTSKLCCMYQIILKEWPQAASVWKKIRWLYLIWPDKDALLNSTFYSRVGTCYRHNNL